MNRTILYYPTIDIPNNSWLRHALLYYDEMSSIVPQSWDERYLINLSPDINYLMGEGQFRPIRPENLMSNQTNFDSFNEFRLEFTETVTSANFRHFLRRKQNQHFRVHRDKTIDTKYRIHRNKTTDSIFDILQENGLAVHSEDYDWLLFEPNTGLLYMSLLAKYLADIDGNQTTIGTDLGVYEKFNFKRVSQEDGFPVVSLNLNNVLPVPRSNVPLEKIIDFKRRRRDNLLHFKKILSDFQVRISKATSNAEFKELKTSFKETLINGVNDLNAVISDSRIDTALKGFKSLISLKSPTTLLTAGAMINERLNVASIPFNWEAFGIGTIGMVEIASCYIQARNNENARLRESSFSYLYHASRSGIIMKP